MLVMGFISLFMNLSEGLGKRQSKASCGCTCAGSIGNYVKLDESDTTPDTHLYLHLVGLLFMIAFTQSYKYKIMKIWRELEFNHITAASSLSL